MTVDFVARALRQAQHRTERLLDDMLAEVGLSTALNGALCLITDEPAITAADLARRAQVKPQSAAHAVTRLEQLGLLERCPHPAHGKAVCLTATPAGRRAARRGAAVLARAESELLKGLAAKERTALLSMLARVQANAEQLIAARSQRNTQRSNTQRRRTR